MFKRYRSYEPGEFFVVGVDTAMGGLDYSAAQFLSKTKLDVPTVYHSKTTSTEMTPYLHTELETIYDKTGLQPVVAYERQNGGVFEMERLATLNRNGKYRIFTMPTYGNTTNPQAKKIGWDTNSATRPKMLQDLKESIDNKVIKLYHKRTVMELFTFIVVQTSSSWRAQAEKNSHDDLVMSLAIAWQLQQMETEPIKHFQIQNLPQFQEVADSDLGL